MNERIDQLWGQALDLAVPETYSQLSHSQVLKVKQVFAELIVQESISALEEKIHRSIDHEGDEIWADLILKEHFGVEE
jgi:hypothetical protein